MKEYFRLIPAIHTPQTISIPQEKNGTLYWKMAKLVAGEEYELEDNELFRKAVLEKTAQVTLTPELKKTLDAYHIPYEIKTCPSCGGRVKKAVYKICEVVKDE